MKLTRLTVYRNTPCTRLVLALAALVTSMASPVLALASSEYAVDQVRVIKHERKLYLMSGDRIVRSYDISLGQNPEGHKRFSGDYRTPEGRYELDWRNANSRFYRSIHISYPGPDDVARATARGLNPGNHIMIHGLPNETEHDSSAFLGVDWTDGCVAVNDNRQMDEIWSLVNDGTPIYILP
jgi:murein L,D-transpeptidase YafK